MPGHEVRFIVNWADEVKFEHNMCLMKIMTLLRGFFHDPTDFFQSFGWRIVTPCHPIYPRLPSTKREEVFGPQKHT